MARPCKTVDQAIVLDLASKGRTIQEIAAYCGISYDTIHRRYASEVERGRAIRDGSLRSKQYDVAMEGNPQMLIWLGKQHLDQTDKAEVRVEVDGNTLKRIADLADRILT